MAQQERYYPSGAVSRYLVPGERSFVNVVKQQGRKITDAELNLDEAIRDDLRKRVSASSSPSGYIRNTTNKDAFCDFFFTAPFDENFDPVPGFMPNSFGMFKQDLIIAGFPLTIEFSNTDVDSQNLFQLMPPPIKGGASPDVKRTDFVFLEAWFALVEPSLNATGDITVANPLAVIAGDTVTIDGVVLTAIAGLPVTSDEFTIGVDQFVTANNLSDAIEATLTTVRPVLIANKVFIVATAAGVVGNSLPMLSSNGAALVLSGSTLSGGVDKPNKPSQDTVYRHGNVDSPLSVAFPDEITDQTLQIANVETTLRVQLQYRIRVVENVNFKVQCDGFSSADVLARGTQVNPLPGYEFVPADMKSIRNNTSAIAYDVNDSGLYIAGDGSETSSTALGTVDGFVYALPLAFVFRRNDAFVGGTGGGFEPDLNTNGGLPYDHALFNNDDVYNAVPPGHSDRPDGYFSDALVATDILDLRRHVSTWGLDLNAELQYQMQSLLDGNFKTWAIDGADKNIIGNGSGDVSTQFLVCNQIGRTQDAGGNPPLSGDTTRGDTIRNFDHIARRFGDQSVVEKRILTLLPSDSQGTTPGKYVTREPYAAAYSGWAEGDKIHLEFQNLNASSLGDFNPIGNSHPSLNIASLWPDGTKVSDILSIYHDDGNYELFVDQRVQLTTTLGLGTENVILTLDKSGVRVTGGLMQADHLVVGNSVIGDVGSSRRIFVEVEITYPIGSGLTDTPDLLLDPDVVPYTFGPMLENDISLDQRPGDMELPLNPLFRTGFREVRLEYVANDPGNAEGHPGAPIGSVVTETVVSRDRETLFFSRRIHGSEINQTVVTDQATTIVKTVDNTKTEYGSSSRKVVLDEATQLSGFQTLSAVTYFAQDPLPNYGGPGLGYQVGVYYRSNAPQTAGVKEGVISETGGEFPYIGIPGPMPNEIVVEPLLISPHLWTGQVGMGSVELPFPYFSPLDQIPVNGLPEDPDPGFPGEWYFSATAQISVTDFEASTGLLTLHSMVQVDGTGRFTFGGDDNEEIPKKDVEFRSYYPFADVNTYRPTAMAQPMSGAVRHKVFTPFLAKATIDSILWRKGELLLIVLSRWAELDDKNTVLFLDEDNKTCSAIYRTKNLMVLVE